MTRTPLSKSKGQGHQAALVGCTGRPTWTYSNGDVSICVHDVYRVTTCRPGGGISWRPPAYSSLLSAFSSVAEWLGSRTCNQQVAGSTADPSPRQSARSQIVSINQPTPNLQAGYPSCRPTNTVEALKGKMEGFKIGNYSTQTHLVVR